MAEEPDVEACLRVIAPRLEGVLKRHRARYNFEEFCEEIVNYVADFTPSIFTGITSPILIANTSEFFDFKKMTLHEMRKEFMDFCKSYWAEIHGEDAEEIVVNIKQQIQIWNEENPQMQFPKINWLPTFGGAVTEQTPFPGYAQLPYMQEHNIRYYISGERVSFRQKQ
jgi:hypothetical protein